MKLYYSPGACSLAPHIVLLVAGLPFELVRASTKTKQLDDGTDYFTINAKGSVPALGLDDGQVLTEGPVITQYLADLAPQSKLAPANGSFERVRLQELLNFITSELHKGYSPLFNPGIDAAAKEVLRGVLVKKYGFIDHQLAGKNYLMGDQFTVADAYLFTVTNWASKVNVDLSAYQNLQAFQARVAARPKVQEAMKAEGLIA